MNIEICKKFFVTFSFFHFANAFKEQLVKIIQSFLFQSNYEVQDVIFTAQVLRFCVKFNFLLKHIYTYRRFPFPLSFFGLLVVFC